MTARSPELDHLAERLQRLFARRPGDSVRWRDPVAMPEALKRVRQAFADRLAEHSGPRTNRALLAFRLAPETVGDADLRLICRAIARPADWEQRRLIDDDQLLARLLARVDALPGRRQRACIGALAATLGELDEPLRGNAQHLADWLRGRR